MITLQYIASVANIIVSCFSVSYLSISPVKISSFLDLLRLQHPRDLLPFNSCAYFLYFSLSSPKYSMTSVVKWLKPSESKTTIFFVPYTSFTVWLNMSIPFVYALPYPLKVLNLTPSNNLFINVDLPILALPTTATPFKQPFNEHWNFIWSKASLVVW